MRFNITFVIQIINFFITYKILTIFMFKPAINSLKEKQEKRDLLQTKIKNKEKELVGLEKEKDENVVSFQQQIKEKYPFIKSLTYDKPLEVEKIKEKKLDEKKLENKIADWLVEKVPDGY